MIIRKDVYNLVKDTRHSFEQFTALFRVLAVGQFVRHQLEFCC